MEVKLIKPYGFCVGVQYVIDELTNIANKHSDKSVFCVGQLVHNQKVVDSIKELGVIVLNEDKEKVIDKIDSGVVVFSAHGTDEKIINPVGVTRAYTVERSPLPMFHVEHAQLWT